MVQLDECVWWTSQAGRCYLGYLLFRLALQAYRALSAHLLPRLFPLKDLSTYGQWAVLTGAGEKIIQEYAKELARRNMNILLISRYLDDILPTARHIESETNVQTKCIPIDFRRGNEIYQEIRKELDGLDIGILVNSVDNRMSETNEFLDNSEQDLWHTIDNNMTSAVMMVSIVSQYMIQKKKGMIVNVTTTYALDPQPNKAAVDAATKAFMLFLSRSVEYELNNFNVEVQTLTLNTVPSHPQNIMFDYPSVEEYAKSAVNTINKAAVTTGHWFHGLLLFLKNVLPESYWNAIQDAGSMPSGTRKEY